MRIHDDLPSPLIKPWAIQAVIPTGLGYGYSQLGFHGLASNNVISEVGAKLF